MPVIVENNTPFPITVYAVGTAEAGKIPPELWRCTIGNVSDRGRQMPVFSAEGILIPGKTESLPDSKPAPADSWKGKLPSPVAVFSNEEWRQLEASPSWKVLEALIKAGDFTQRRAT
jgi:hypothetical protein